MFKDIVEIQEHLITYDSSSWIIGELVAEGWKILNVVEVGATSYDWEYVHEGSLCILGRPSNIEPRTEFGQVCRPIIRSGRVSKKCHATTICSVPSCENRAMFEVIFYGYKSEINLTHFETDFTCPYICEEHMQDNEAMAVGKREPRSRINYPFTKKNGGQAYTKYLPASFANI